MPVLVLKCSCSIAAGRRLCLRWHGIMRPVCTHSPSHPPTRSPIPARPTWAATMAIPAAAAPPMATSGAWRSRCWSPTPCSRRSVRCPGAPRPPPALHASSPHACVAEGRLGSCTACVPAQQHALHVWRAAAAAQQRASMCGCCLNGWSKWTGQQRVAHVILLLAI